GQPDLGLRRGRNDGMLIVANDDIADADGDADPPCTLDLRSADLDRVAVADVLFDRRGEPGRGDVEIDWTGPDPPPQGAEAAGEDHHQGDDRDREPPHPAFAGQPAEPGEPVAGAAEPGVRLG